MDVTVPDTYAESHLANTVVTPGAAANQAAQQKQTSTVVCSPHTSFVQ